MDLITKIKMKFNGRRELLRMVKRLWIRFLKI